MLFTLKLKISQVAGILKRLNGFISYHVDLQILWEKYYGKGGDETVF